MLSRRHRRYVTFFSKGRMRRNQDGSHSPHPRFQMSLISCHGGFFVRIFFFHFWWNWADVSEGKIFLFFLFHVIGQQNKWKVFSPAYFGGKGKSATTVFPHSPFLGGAHPPNTFFFGGPRQHTFSLPFRYRAIAWRRWKRIQESSNGFLDPKNENTEIEISLFSSNRIGGECRFKMQRK